MLSSWTSVLPMPALQMMPRGEPDCRAVHVVQALAVAAHYACSAVVPSSVLVCWCWHRATYELTALVAHIQAEDVDAAPDSLAAEGHLVAHIQVAGHQHLFASWKG